MVLADEESLSDMENNRSLMLIKFLELVKCSRIAKQCSLITFACDVSWTVSLDTGIDVSLLSLLQFRYWRHNHMFCGNWNFLWIYFNTFGNVHK